MLCTAGSGPHVELLDLTGPSLEHYAARHGYAFTALHERLARARPAAWDKVELLHALVAEHDLVVWVDADALVLPHAPDIADAIDDHRFMHLVEHHTPQGRIPNTGVLTLRGGRSSTEFLERVWAQRRFIHNRWWENAAINHLLGYRRIPRLGIQPVVPSRRRARMGRLDRAWNSIPDDAAVAPFIVHFPGIPLADRARKLGRYVAARA